MVPMRLDAENLCDGGVFLGETSRMLLELKWTVGWSMGREDRDWKINTGAVTRTREG